MADKAHTTRRSMFALAAGASLAAAVPAHAVTPHHALEREADELMQMTALLNMRGYTESFAEAWERRQAAFLARVEALPLTRENARIKARAIEVLYGDLDEMTGGEPATTDRRLAVQVLRCLLH